MKEQNRRKLRAERLSSAHISIHDRCLYVVVMCVWEYRQSAEHGSAEVVKQGQNEKMQRMDKDVGIGRGGN